MCGIAGIIGLDATLGKTSIQKMCASMAHRGPDADGIYSEKNISLGHRRLSIIDLSNDANQPFEDFSGRYKIVYNGEIYNYKAIKEKIDYPWKTNSDTEVILAAYIKWGTECLQYLNGMFAFAVWDTLHSELFIARDRLGVKPFYYYHSKDIFVFGSELRTVLASEITERKINADIIPTFLSYMSVPTPNTLVKDVFQLCPGEYAFFKKGELTKNFYWHITSCADDKLNKKTYDHAKQIRDQFEQSVESRMVADVKVGAFLSGGIDSSAVVAAMSKINKTDLETFSIVFNESDFDESKYSRRIAKKYGTKHTELLLKPKELLQILPEYIKSMDNPTVDGINTYIISKMVAKTGIKVVLTGIGGDELFAGYTAFKRWQFVSKYGKFFQSSFFSLLFKLITIFYKKRPILKLKHLLSIKPNSLKDFYNNSRMVFFKDEIDALMNTKIENKSSWLDLDSPSVKKLPLLSQYTLAELSHYTLDVLLKDTDQMSMAWSLEVREPFFDYQLLSLLLSIDDNVKVSDSIPKKLLVQAMGSDLPSEIVYRKKKGFTFPWKFWLKNELNQYCKDALESLSQRGIFNSKGIFNLWNAFLSNKRGITWVHIWGLVVLEKWIEENNIKV